MPWSARWTTGTGNVGSPLELTDYDPIRTVGILALTSDAAPVALLSAPDDVALNIDVADDVIALGTHRAGHPPTGLSPYVKVGLAVGSATVLLGCAAVAVLVVMLRRRRRLA